MKRIAITLALLSSVCAAQSPPPPENASVLASTGTLPGGALWAADVPRNWNGVLLLWSRGYSPRAGVPEPAPREYRQALLDLGYGLAASNYGAEGWALVEAVPAQRGTVAAFTAVFGKPRRVIGWGASMGGLVSTALAEERRPVIQGALPLCSSMGGAVGMMNMALDGAFAFRTLIAPDAGIELTGVSDDMANSRKVSAALAEAVKTPEGRARVALAGVLGGIPGWTRRDRPEPVASDGDAQLDEMAATFVMGIMLPRGDQERRSAGSFSWNNGIDYTAQLARSGRRAMVAALYAKAGLSLDADLARLAVAPRIAASRQSVQYMMQHYTPTARPRVPVLAVQAMGDGMTSPSLQAAYVDAAHSRDVRALWTHSAGHCTFAAQPVIAAIRYLDQRLARGRWGDQPEGFVPHTPAPMLRPCWRDGKCD